jgi:UDP-galactopyranose mutase|tara:strand:- start:148 stop:1248 length:1101 start_codon:yes stop_codon:yes gene_type:complete
LKKYDYLIVGCGLFGITFAKKAIEDGKKCLIIDKRHHIGGNCYTEEIEEIDVHVYGPHIFHTSDKRIWDYVNEYAEFNHYVNRPKVNYNGKIYSFPINLMTLYQLWGVTTPEDAIAKIESSREKIDNPKNLEEWALSQVGREIYETFIKGYTKKQWMMDPKDLPSAIIRRLPIRLTFDDNYFNDKYQGIPIGGYTKMMKKMLGDIEVKLETDYFSDKEYFDNLAEKVVFTGKIDEFYDYRFGELEYKTLRFHSKVLDKKDFQGNAVVNYTSEDVPYTRICEHKHFQFGKQDKTVITYEYPVEFTKEKIPYYPVNNTINNDIYSKYKTLSKQQEKVIFGGRLAEYKYYDMHQIIGSAWSKYSKVEKK